MKKIERAVKTLALILALALTAGLTARPLRAQQKVHEEYTKKILEFTTDPCFSTPYVNYLPYAPGVPTPLEVLGRVAGARDIISSTAEVYKYMRALAAATPRVKVFDIGKTEEGRDWIVVAVADEAALRDLDRYKGIMAKLADPRRLSEAEAGTLLAQAKPIYWVTGGLHSTETGSVEMLMELAYRIAVDDAPFVKAIRENVITLITPVLEPDGRDKEVDVAMAKRRDPKANAPARLVYWGKYVSHDNNRDNLGLALKLSQHITRTFLDFHPLVMHDLHESMSYLYISTGTGPYNAWLDPITIDEWNLLAYREVTELTKAGVPGVWTQGFYDGWTPNYAFYAANGHNAIGRFYETQTAGDGSTRVVSASADRAWFKPNPPLRSALWSLRNNVNVQQSGVLVALNHVAALKDKFLESFYLKGRRSIAKARAEGPAAYVFPGDDPRPGQQAGLLRQLQAQGVEVHRADKPFKVKNADYPAGTFVVRMDQPYSRMADMMLDRQYFNVNDPSPYDDVGWTLGPLYNVKTVRVEDVAVLDAPMTLVRGDVAAPGGVARLGQGAVRAYIINHNADNVLATFRFARKDLKIQAAEKAFEAQGRKFRAGSFILKPGDNPGDLEKVLDEAGRRLGFAVAAVPAVPDVPCHEAGTPRVAVMHTWQNTQSEGWLRIALDQSGIPYDYISVHAVRDNARLRDKYDVILFGPSSADPFSIVNGLGGDKPLPWKKTELTPNIGSEDSTDDMRGGLELDGVLHLRDFVRDGGVFVTIGNSSALPIHFGLARGLSIRDTSKLWARGGVFLATVGDRTSPLAYGYDDQLGVYFSQSPVFGLGGMSGRSRSLAPQAPGSFPGRVSGRGGAADPDIAQGRPLDLGRKAIEEFRKNEKDAAKEGAEGGPEPPAPSARPRIVVSFAGSVADLLISGGLAGGEELAGSPALADVTIGRGHVVLFSFNPAWRSQTRGSYFFIFNALLNWKNLDAAAR
ncbi:MAG TPA: M14 family zinc carboxypeptidase [Candidatus Aminicenantes bacterium]|nr:M14 family zinc carboxypeptidase [Candidatus Aminicenantes bacterium]HRY63864.1 M14 family zinc carboxypeptidase [Candidatus Aminicenantes bacterium]HRZ70777.1 M14 family zinc carboxypeptidase [Candidatus Aminicenantes bacterium]